MRGCLTVCATSLKCTYAPTAPVCQWDAAIHEVIDAFSQQDVTSRTNLSMTGAGAYKCNQRAGKQLYLVVLKFLSQCTHLEGKQTMAPLDVLSGKALSMLCLCQLASAWYVIALGGIHF